MSVALNEGDRTLSVSIDEKDEAIKSVRARRGTTRAVLANMITGDGRIREEAEVVGVGYRRAGGPEAEGEGGARQHHRGSWCRRA
ncbi:MAG: hypothetical protein R3B46_04430 [Phycisphaerales bacterium]